MSLVQRWALVSELTTNELSGSQLAQIAAAVSLQSTRDVAPEWGTPITMQAFPDPKHVPLGYSPATIMGLDQMPQGALGFHYTKHRQPAANIGFDPSDPAGVSVTVSHETAIEAAIDPSGNRMVVGTIPGVGRVEVLVEGADPPEAFTYVVDGFDVSDWVLKSYYGPHRWSTPHKPAGGGPGVTVPGVPAAYSFCKRIDTPLSVARGGYLSFRKPDGEWMQLTWFDGPQPALRTLGRRDDDDLRSHREWIDSVTAKLSLPHVGRIGN